MPCVIRFRVGNEPLASVKAVLTLLRKLWSDDFFQIDLLVDPIPANPLPLIADSVPGIGVKATCVRAFNHTSRAVAICASKPIGNDDGRQKRAVLRVRDMNLRKPRLLSGVSAC